MTIYPNNHQPVELLSSHCPSVESQLSSIPAYEPPSSLIAILESPSSLHPKWGYVVLGLLEKPGCSTNPVPQTWTHFLRSCKSVQVKSKFFGKITKLFESLNKLWPTCVHCRLPVQIGRYSITSWTGHSHRGWACERLITDVVRYRCTYISGKTSNDEQTLFNDRAHVYLLGHIVICEGRNRD